MSDVDKDGWQKAGWLHINPDVKERLKRIEANQNQIIGALKALAEAKTPKKESRKKK